MSKVDLKMKNLSPLTDDELMECTGGASKLFNAIRAIFTKGKVGATSIGGAVARSAAVVAEYGKLMFIGSKLSNKNKRMAGLEPNVYFLWKVKFP